MAIPRNLANIAPHVNASSTELVVNDGGANLDFRVEGDTDANTLFVDAGNNRIGIGTNAPTTRFQISQSSAGPTVNLNRLGDTSGNAVIQSTGSTGTINASITLGGGSDNVMTFATGSTAAERARITSDGYLRMASGSGGIQFNGDTAAGNALDDYEEGTWTPAVGRTGSSYVFGDNANGYRTGKYVKIGNTVYCWFSLTIISISTQGSGGNSLSGLPFASGGGAFARYGGSVLVCQVLTTATSLFLGGVSQTTAGFANQSNEGLSSNFTTGNVFGFLSYQTS